MDKVFGFTIATDLPRLDRPNRRRATENPVRVNEVVIAVVIFAFIAAVVIPNILSPARRDSRKATGSAMRTIGSAMEAYRKNNGVYPIAVTISQLAKELEGTYQGALPDKDGWGGQFVVYSTPTSYTLISLARDGKLGTFTPGQTEGLDSDIVLNSGIFVQYPAGWAWPPVIATAPSTSPTGASRADPHPPPR